VRRAACDARLAQALGTPADESFTHAVLFWVCQQQDNFKERRGVTLALDYMKEMRDVDPSFSCSGKTVKSIMRSREIYQCTTLTFAEGEQFQRNPEGIRGFFRQDASIPLGTKIVVPYDGLYSVTANTPRLVKPVTVRISEVRSLRRLIYDGEQLGNCLRSDRFSQLKYVSRARDQSSSFWSMTILREGGRLEHQCLIEVWHLEDGNIVHQAEGPRPRTIPTAEAWYWLEQWCAAEGLVLDEWDCYS